MVEHRRDTFPGRDTCPSWCVRRHAAHSHPEDLLHQSSPRYTVLVTGRPWRPETLPDASSVVGRVIGRTGSADVWLEVTSEENDAVRICVTPASARELVTVLESLIAQAGS
jgi:hypothetical protein